MHASWFQPLPEARPFASRAVAACPPSADKLADAKSRASSLQQHVLRAFAIAALALVFAASAHAEPVQFDLPAQSADRALLAFSKQAKIDVLFSFDDLRKVRSNPVVGQFEPQEALERLLRGTGFAARRNGDAKWIVTPTSPPAGNIKGKLYAPDGSPARRVHVVAVGTGFGTFTNDNGDFAFDRVPVGHYLLVATADNCRPLELRDVNVPRNRTITLPPHTLQRVDDPARLEPFIVEETLSGSPLDHSEALLRPHSAGGNLDLPRTESEALPYMIFNRAQITRSGVVDLNEFLQRELIIGNVGSLPPEQDGSADTFAVGSTNLSLRGFGEDETVILVDGRRLPEVLTSPHPLSQTPDVNFIPVSLVQQIEVLPVSASAIYSGNAVGGVINIVLRPDLAGNATEVTATYTNALSHFDAPESSFSLLHTQTLLGGALRVRLNASFVHTMPATEAELGLHQKHFNTVPPPDQPIYRATPNVRSISPAPGAPQPGLFGSGTAPVTSVAPGSDGATGLAAFSGREGVRNLAFFDSPGGFAPSLDSIDYPYGREQRRATYYGSAVYDAFPWLQLAIDGTYSMTVVNRGFDVLPADLLLKANSPFNPFHQDVRVSLNETAPALGEHFSEARLEFASVVLSAILKLPSDWRLTFDSQYAHNLVKYRGLIGASLDRWQALVDSGGYNPLRDTQVFGPPQAFYDHVLIYRSRYGHYATLGNYDTLDLALRATNDALNLPTGKSTLNIGGDFRRNHLAKYNDEGRFGDGTLADTPIRWEGRTLDRYSAFTELQAPLVPESRLPSWLRHVDSDTALRYVASNNAHEANFAPTFALKVGLPAGFTFRGSVTTSNRFPTPQMSRIGATPGAGGSSVDRELIHDPVRNSDYVVNVLELLTPDLHSEAAVTQTAGLIFERGHTHRFRAAIDFVDTHKVNELVFLDANSVVSAEAFWPERVQRAAPEPGAPAGLITSVLTSRANLASRHSQDWTASTDYRWNACFGGTLEAYARVLYFQKYTVRSLPNMPLVDELNAPDPLVAILKYRGNLGAAWSNQRFGFGTDGHYYHSRKLPRDQWEAQGSDHIDPFWQWDVFVQSELTQWLPWKITRYGLRAQARVNNVFATGFPKYASETSGTGVQPYGDWRGRVYSLSVTATF